MGKYFALIFLLFTVVLDSCEKVPYPPADPDCKVPVIRDDNMIIEVLEDSLFLSLVLENYDTIMIPEKCIINYSLDSSEWKLICEFVGRGSRSYPFYKENLEIMIDTVIINPSGFVPPSALIKCSLAAPGIMKAKVIGRSELSADFNCTYKELKTEYEIPIFGLYSDYENIVELSIVDLNGKTITADSIKIPIEPYTRVQCGEMNVVTNALSGIQKNRLFFIQNAVYDGAGDVRWYTIHSGEKFFTLSGDLIGIQVFPDKGWINPGPDILIIDHFGFIQDTFNVPNRLHHEISEKTPGGNLLVATNAQPYVNTDDDTEDMIVEIDRETGAVLKEWDLRQIFDPERPRIWTENRNDWCHLNSIQYDNLDNTLLISSKLQCFISKIDYETGQIKWILGNHNNWGEKWQPYLLDPLNFDTTNHIDQDWTYAQHMPRLTGDGTIMVYDNGMQRPGGEFGRAVEYRVDQVQMTVEKIWSHNLGYPARTMGSVHIYEDNTVQIGHGGLYHIYVVSRDGDILFDGALKTFYRSYDISFYD